MGDDGSAAWDRIEAAFGQVLAEYSSSKHGAIVPEALDFAGVQAACAKAGLANKRVWAAGEITTDQTLVIDSDADLGGLTINYTGAGTAVRAGKAAASLFRKGGTLPRIKTTRVGSWDSEKTGLQMVNNDTCVWVVPYVQNFDVGLDEVGDNRGHAYNTITIGHLDNNKVNNRLRGTGTGWANQNLHIGGRLAHYSSETSPTPGSRHVQIVSSANLVNNNTWIGSSFEYTVPEYHAEIGGVSNTFINCRWESAGGPRVLWGAGATRNQIVFGYDSHRIKETSDARAGGSNIIFSSSQLNLAASSAGPLLQLRNGGSAGYPADVVLSPTASGDPSVAYSVLRSANQTGMKRDTDAVDRIRQDHLNGRTYYGNGATEPAVHVGAIGDRLRLATLTSTTAPAAGYAEAPPTTPAGYAEVYLAGAIRKIPYY